MRRVKRNRFLRLGLALALLSLAACTVQKSAGAPEDDPSIAGTIKLEDNGGDIKLTVGQRFLLALGSDYEWSVDIEDRSVLNWGGSVFAKLQGSQGSFAAKKTGRTVLKAEGVPVCRSDKPPCSSPSRSFRLEVIVR